MKMTNQNTVATYFKSLSIKNFRGLADVSLKLTNENKNENIAQWTLLLGDNGVGKTTLLQCLCWMRPALVEDEEPDNQETENAESVNSSKLNTETKDDIDGLITKGKIGSVITGEYNEALELFLRIGENTELILEAVLCQGVELNSPEPISKVPEKNKIKTKITFFYKDGVLVDEDTLQNPNPDEEKTDIEEKLGEFWEPLIISYGANRWKDVKYLGNINIQDPLAANLSAKGTELHDAEEELTTLQSSVNEQRRKKLEELLKRADKGEKVKLEDALDEEETDEARRLRIFKDVFIKILPDDKTVEDIEIEAAKVVNGDLKPPQVKLRIFDVLVPFSELSLGYQTTLTWVLDLAWQLMTHYSKSSDPLKEPAVVLVDEIDLHLHPHWQRTIMSRLSRLFPRIQFIATSHSPLMVQSMPDANFAIVREIDSDIKIENAPEDVEGWRLDQITNSEYFGLNFSRSPKTEKLFKKRNDLLMKLDRSPEEETELKKLQKQISLLRTETTPEEDEAILYLEKAAELLKQEELSKNDKDK